ncbi:hypothetical protein [Streptomyces sp. 4R-3d]|uniref:hypothetical protein n=1 Tax=Streptomyces sp. 4R-3d TaxID=2559605 RepID=UPI0010719E82|nr:hypothetical protein [Streptomyces sp. 4R-3d]TFI30118.1 hypothetical protein E4P36_05045 [Streptomyces sp. 4R-3d]
MTDQPTRDRLLHLADRARRGVALPAEHDALAAGITELVAERDRAEAALDRVRQLAERWQHTGDRKNTALPELRAALNGPKEN